MINSNSLWDFFLPLQKSSSEVSKTTKKKRKRMLGHDQSLFELRKRHSIMSQGTEEIGKNITWVGRTCQIELFFFLDFYTMKLALPDFCSIGPAHKCNLDISIGKI